jgi:hypothetical protein
MTWPIEEGSMAESNGLKKGSRVYWRRDTLSEFCSWRLAACSPDFGSNPDMTNDIPEMI